MSITLSPLPYDRTALEPHISGRTLEIHHGKHHSGYVDKVNDAIEGTALADATLEQIISETADDDERQNLFNSAAQTWNHDFFWSSMRPDGGGRPTGKLADAIESAFGNHDAFKEAFADTATSQFGSGWAWLVADSAGAVKTVSTGDADLPLTDGLTPLLTCDVWEHAYYLDYQNERGSFVNAFLDKLVNWDFAEKNYAGGS